MPYYITNESPDCNGWAVMAVDSEEVFGCHADKQSAIDQGVAISLAEDVEFLGERASRAVDLGAPEFMREAASRGLEWYAEGLAGDGLVERTVNEARAMARGNVTADKWVRISAWIARHLADLDSPDADPESDDYPSAGVVAHALWGSSGGKDGARRAKAYADRIIGRIEADNAGRAKGEAVSKIETRVLVNDFEVRETSDGMTLTGYAARFNQPSEDMGFVEQIAPGAFKRSLRARSDIKMLWNHNSDMPLASTRSGTLRLSETELGLFVEADLPDTQAGRDAKVLIQRGDVTGFSFGFTVPPNGDSWNSDGTLRTLKSVRLLEVSAGVSFPAYPSTIGSAQVRSLEEITMTAELDLEMVTVALEKIAAGEPISEVEKEMIETVMDQLVPAEDMAEDKPEEGVSVEVEVDDNGADMLALKRKKLALLELLDTL